MILTNTVNNVSLGQASLYALLGYGVVFFGLFLLMMVIVLLGKYFMAAAQKKIPVAETAAPAEMPAPAEAPGAAGQLKLHNVEPKVAAMLMAITADKIGKPLNELRFLSIKEVAE